MQKMALASDIDGTLVFYASGNYSGIEEKGGDYCKEEDLSAIAAWQSEGNLFGVCSGRPLVGVFEMLPDGVSPDFYIACSGAAIFDKNRNVVYESVIDPGDLQELLEKYSGTSVYNTFHTDSRDTLFGTIRLGLDIRQIIITSLDEIRDRKIYSMSMIFEDDEKAEAACADINKNYPTLTAFQNKNSTDIVSRGCSKGEGILRIKEYLQVEMIAGIGDSFNDLPMLLAAQTSFTFHSSSESIRRQVTYVVDSVAEALGILGRQ